MIVQDFKIVACATNIWASELANLEMKDICSKRRSIGRSISHLHAHIRVHLQKELEQYGIGSGQYVYLLMLYRMDGSSQDDLTERVKVDKATTTRAIVKLISSGYIRRSRDPSDRRRFIVHLTQKGWDFKPILRSTIDKWTDGLLDGFSNDEKEQLFYMLDRLEENAEGMP